MNVISNAGAFHAMTRQMRKTSEWRMSLFYSSLSLFCYRGQFKIAQNALRSTLYYCYNRVLKNSLQHEEIFQPCRALREL